MRIQETSSVLVTFGYNLSNGPKYVTMSHTVAGASVIINLPLNETLRLLRERGRIDINNNGGKVLVVPWDSAA